MALSSTPSSYSQLKAVQHGSGDTPQSQLPRIIVTHPDALYRPPSTSTAEGTIERPAARSAATSLIVPTYATLPVVARPTVRRAASTSLVLSHTVTNQAMAQAQPNMLRRATQVLSQQLEFGQSSAAAHRNTPASPTHWNGNAHRQYLVIVWDKTVEVAAKSSKYPKSTTAQLVATQQTMIRKFPELSEGAVTLTREWIEYVLGVALRHPFCTAERMGRWEVLASSGGARGTWGPW